MILADRKCFDCSTFLIAYSKHSKISPNSADLSLSLPLPIIVLPLKIIVHLVSPGSQSLQRDPTKTCRPFHDAAK